MSSIDNRIVQMEFDNKQFESGVSTSLSTLEKLKQGLNLEASAKSLAGLGDIGKSFSLGSIGESVDAIAGKFSALGIVGITALQNITNSAIDAGKKMISALTIDPIKTGLNEYETKMGAIQTILTNTASKGTSLDDVNRVLGDLNEYSDKTIYNFAEMAKNIGTFTAAGIDLDASANAIKGIANLAAGSGSTSTQASTAMYQLSQALAGGSVKLQDWNSVVNAGMGGELFQNALKDTAKQMGIVVDESVPFRESLKDGWITADVLTDTLERFAEDESLVKAATEVKTLTQMYDTMKETVQSGWATSWEHIIGDKAQSTATLTAISEAFNSIMGPSTDARNNMLEFWNANGGRDAIITAVTNSFKALGDILRPVGEAFREVFPAMTGERLVAISEKIKDLTANFKISDETAAAIKRTFEGLFSAIDIVGQVVGTVVQGFGLLIGALLPTGDGILGVTSSIGGFLTSLRDSIETSGIFTTALEKFKGIIEPIPNIFDGLGKIGEIFFKFAKKVADAVATMGGGIADGLANIDFGKVFDIFQGGLFATILLGVKKFVDSLTDSVSNIGGFLKGVTGVLDGVRGSLEAMQNNLKAGTILKIAAAIGILAISLLVLSKIDEESLSTALAAITFLFVELVGSMIIFEKVAGGMSFKSMITLSTTMIALSAAVLILSFAMTKLAELDWGEVAKGLVTIAALSGILVVTAKLLSADTGAMIKGAAGYILFAAAIVILAEAVKKLGGLDIPTLAKGLVSIGILMAGLVVFVNMVSGEKMTGTAIGLTILAVAMLMFSNVIENLGGMPISTLAIGLISLAAALTIIATAMHFMKGALPGAAALLAIAAALAILAPVLKILGNMSLVEIGKSLLTLVAAFVVLGGAAAILTPVIPALIGLAGAMALLGVGIVLIGGGLLAISAGLTALAISGAAGAAGLTIVVSSIIGLIPMFLEQVGKAIIAFANVIGDGAPAIVGAVAAVLTAIAEAIIIAVPVMMEAVLVFLTTMLDTIVAFVPKLIDGGMQLILGILTGIRDNIQKIVEIAIEIVVKFIDGVASMIPKVIDSAFKLIISFINGLADAIRGNTDTLILAIKNLMTAVFEAGLKVLTGSVTLFEDVGALIMNSGFIQGIKDKISKAVDTVKEIPTKAISAIKTFVKDFISVGGDLIGGFIKGIKEGIGDVIDAARDVASKAIRAVKNRLDSNSPSKEFEKLGMYSDQGFAGGLTKFSGVVSKAAKGVGTTAINSLSNSIANISDVVSGDMNMNPTIRPVLDLSSVTSGVGTLDGLFSKQQGISVIGNMKNASTISPNGDISIIDKIREAIKMSSSKAEVDLTGTLQVQVINDKGEIVSIAETAIKDILRRESR